MGGEPKTVLNIVGFPLGKIGGEVLADILKGSASKVEEAGAVIAGGHSIDDNEPKFGLSVTGVVHPEHYYKNVGARPGDLLVLTKPIGVGIQTTAIKQDKISDEQLQRVTAVMAQLNKIAAETLRAFHPNAVTDVTGFGLLGHALEMAEGTGVSLVIRADAVPVLAGTRELADDKAVPGGSKKNREWLKSSVSYGDCIDETEQLILCDAVTSGGLLISLPEEEAEAYVRTAHEKGLTDTAVIGQVKEKRAKAIYVE